MKSENTIRVKTAIKFIFCSLILFISTTFLLNKILILKEKQMLIEAGYYNPVSIRDYALNVYDFGNKQGKHTFVGISGRGVFDYSVRMHRLMDSFAEENRIVIVDRAGYGLSDDTKDPQTVASVVNDYREALHNAGIEGPYILLPHSIGGAYATYWVSNYPEDVEGVVFLDGTILTANCDLPEGDVMVHRLAIVANQMGLIRLGKSLLLQAVSPGMNYSDEQRTYSEALYLHNPFNSSTIYEEEHSNEICNTSYNEMVQNDVPKIYISANLGFQTTEEVDIMLAWDKQECEFIGRKQPDVSKSMYNIDTLKWVRENELQPYLDKMGNCELVLLPGIHCIYDQRPDDVADIIRGFLDRIEE